VSFVSGPINLADALTKCTTGNNIYNLMTEDTVPVIPFLELKRLWQNSSTKKQYIFETIAQYEYKKRPKIEHRTRFVGPQKEDSQIEWEDILLHQEDLNNFHQIFKS
jgi:hypothetical protein